MDKDGPLPRDAALGPCWIWTAAVHSNGYGNFYMEGRYYNAHVAGYLIAGGTLEPRQQVDHRCHRELCVRPSHLRASTPGQNQQNRSGSQRGSSSRFRGVYWNTRQARWFVRVTVAGKVHWGGAFPPDQEDAAGERARLMRLELMTHNAADRVG